PTSGGGHLQAGGARRARGQGGGQGEAAIVVAVPVEADLGTDRLPDPADQGGCSVGGGVADGVAEAEASRACVDGRFEQPRQVVRFAAGRVLGDVRHGETVVCCEFYSFYTLLLDEADVPLFRILADRRAADERVDLERNAGLLLQVGRRRDVADEREAGHVDANIELGVALFLRQPFHRRLLVRARPGQADIELRHAEIV